jgi:hypothetical protein
MKKETKGWLRYFVIIFDARVIQLRADQGRWSESAHSHAAAYEKVTQVLMRALREDKLPEPQELADIFGDGYPPIAEQMLAEITSFTDDVINEAH